MKNSVIRSIINNTFLPNYGSIKTYFRKNNVVYNEENIIPGGFTLDFFPTNSKELFEQNLKTQPENWYYRTHEVKYTLNSLGYRTKEFDEIDWKESIVMFGCSFVFGIGVTDEHTIPYFLEELSGRPVINMGIQGASIQTMLHNSIIFTDSKYPTPKAVINAWPNAGRYQLYQNNSSFNFGDWNYLPDQKFSKKENLIPFNLMNIKMIRNLWKNKTIYHEAQFYFHIKTLIDRLDNKIISQFYPATCSSGTSARDLQHIGPSQNFENAKRIYENLKPQLNS